MRSIHAFAERWLTDQNLVYLAFFSVWLPYPVTAVVLLFLGVYLLASKRTRGRVFCHRLAFTVPVFALLTFFVALYYRNWLGMLCSVAYFLIMVVALFARSVMTRTIFERALNGCCLLSLPLLPIGIVDRLLHLGEKLFRFDGWFFNPNYLATIMSTVILICAYKVTARKGSLWFYYATAVCAAVTMYLCGSMFAWVELLMGVSVLLSLMRQHQLLSILLLLTAVCGIILYCVPEIFPRLSETNFTTEFRISIWNLSMRSIPEAPVFGRGFLSYRLISHRVPGAYLSEHAHNLVLEPLLSFGVVGTALFLLYFIPYYRTVLRCKNRIHKSHITALILSLTAATLIHGTTDMTMLWLQTGLFFMLILSGVGADEKVLAARLERLREYAAANGEN